VGNVPAYCGRCMWSPYLLCLTHLDGFHPRQVMIQHFCQLLLLQPAARRHGGVRRRRGGRRRGRVVQANWFVSSCPFVLPKTSGQQGRCGGRGIGRCGGWRGAWRGAWRGGRESVPRCRSSVVRGVAASGRARVGGFGVPGRLLRKRLLREVLRLVCQC
jgi:hypothetical protein